MFTSIITYVFEAHWLLWNSSVSFVSGPGELNTSKWYRTKNREETHKSHYVNCFRELDKCYFCCWRLFQFNYTCWRNASIYVTRLRNSLSKCKNYTINMTDKVVQKLQDNWQVLSQHWHENWMTCRFISPTATFLKPTLCTCSSNCRLGMVSFILYNKNGFLKLSPYECVWSKYWCAAA